MLKTGKNTENHLEMIYMTKDQKECVFKTFVHKVRVKTHLIIQNSLTNDQNGQTAQKLKGGKTRQNLLQCAENRLEVFS